MANTCTLRRSDWAEDIVHAALFLASDETDYITGGMQETQGVFNVLAKKGE